MEEENKRILSAVEYTDYSEVMEADADYEFEKVHLFTVSYMSDVSRLKCYEVNMPFILLIVFEKK